jgi:hypothetical protein
MTLAGPLSKCIDSDQDLLGSPHTVSLAAGRCEHVGLDQRLECAVHVSRRDPQLAAHDPDVDHRLAQQ